MNTRAEINERLGTKDVLWDLTVFYQDINDENITKDRDSCLTRAKEFYEKYNSKLGTLSNEEFHTLLDELTDILSTRDALLSYAFLLFSINTNDPKYSAFYQAMKEFDSQVQKYTFFFEHQWMNLPDEIAERFLNDERLKNYHHYLHDLRKYRPHILTEVEEKVLIEFSPVTLSSWISLFDKIRSTRKYGEEGKTEEELLTLLYHPKREVRRKASEEFTEGLKEDIHTIAHIFNTILGHKAIDDRLRNYSSWMSYINLSNELDDDTVNALIEAVTDRYDLVQRYYTLKREILGLDELFDYDRYAPIHAEDEEDTSWKECKEIIFESFAGFSGEMLEIAKKFYDFNWIHAPLKDGKMSGAFSHPTVPQKNPFILVNYTGNLRDVETVAHELGHGIHQYLSRDAGYFNYRHPLVLAETASVFAELLVYENLKAKITNPRKKLRYVCAKIESTFATVFRQIAMNRFEDLIHRHRREKGELSVDDFNNYWLTTQRQMFGDSVTLTDNYGYWWSYIGHFVHLPGYVYAYAFGELLVLSLYNLYRSGQPEFVKNYINLLKSGSSDTPYNLLKPFNIDLRKKEFWSGGLEIIAKMIDEAYDIKCTL